MQTVDKPSKTVLGFLHVRTSKTYEFKVYLILSALEVAAYVNNERFGVGCPPLGLVRADVINIKPTFITGSQKQIGPHNAFSSAIDR